MFKETVNTEAKGEVVGAPTENPKEVTEPATQKPQGEVVGVQAGTVEAGAVQNEWQWRDGVIGQGDRPEWLMEKYNTVEDQAKANKDAQSLIGQLNQKMGVFTGAPDEYDFSKLEGEGFEFNKEHPWFANFVTECKNANISQEFASKLATIGKELVHTEPMAKSDEESKKYGESFEQDKTNITNWINNNSTEADAKELMGSVKTAGAMRALNSLRTLSGNTNIPVKDIPVVPKETFKDQIKSFTAKAFGAKDASEQARNDEEIQAFMDKHQGYDPNNPHN